ncbi:hypothetical protein ASPWEDRAFT_268352 [Aspergillus wentii DTO 134E9]|uniref:Uncharacterized protein n=1 Tax=Aspergillus wentii DTO 134E9 TaxID=1073089 RepID=A0A1L9S2Q8_ASPWE|nr:uncharacterized protein ASPWEDRAFT_268352 [Aspergillus wentii DTO 134E9]OJJ41443.1 hypothetical protein ASPWEDRAFT_268352 [Aspergillus wentii DTO 134E9]
MLFIDFVYDFFCLLFFFFFFFFMIRFRNVHMWRTIWWTDPNPVMMCFYHSISFTSKGFI